MQQLTQAIWAVVLVTSLFSHTEAKRGCAAYGHSCFGGHGKRSGTTNTGGTVPDCKDDRYGTNPDCPPKMGIPIFGKYQRLNQEVAYPTTNQLGPNRYDVAQSIMEQRDLQYAVYNIIRQMVENARKANAVDASAESRLADDNQI